MTRRWLFVSALVSLPAVVISLSVPMVAWAQPYQPPPPAVPGPPVAQPAPPPAAPAVQERPMRFMLTGGTVVIGTRVGEDAEFFTVNTASGLVRVRKSDVASMDFNVSAGTTTVPTVAAAPSLPPPTFNYTATPPRRPGRGLLIAGTIMFSITYGLTVFGATIASVDNSDAFLLLLPVAGPVVYAAVDEDVADDGTLALFVNITLLQAAGLIMLIVGASKASGGSRTAPAQARLPGQFRLGQADLRLDPVVTPRVQGVALSATF